MIQLLLVIKNIQHNRWSPIPERMSLMIWFLLEIQSTVQSS